MNLKVSVLSSGSILLDGMPVALENLRVALEQADRANDRVLYYREDAAAEPPPETKEVLDLVIANKLPISLSSKPDFSDYADRFGQLHPRPEESGGPPNRFDPRMPDVDLRADTEAAFAKARAKASGENENYRIAMVRPDRAVLFFPLPPPPPQTSQMAKQLAAVIPSDRSRNIAVITSTGFTMSPTGSCASLHEANSAIPFIGILCGLAYLGHRIWIFEGHASALALGLEQSDVLVVDSGMLPFLQPDWMQVAQRVMQRVMEDVPRIFVHDRKTYRLLQKVPSHVEPDGEGSYANCLLTALGKGIAESVEIATGSGSSKSQDPRERSGRAEMDRGTAVQLRDARFPESHRRSTDSRGALQTQSLQERMDAEDEAHRKRSGAQTHHFRPASGKRRPGDP